jgi:hypothetical protein
VGLRQLAQYRAKAEGLGLAVPFTLAGAPTNGAAGSFVGRAVVGSLLVDTTTPKLYQATAATTPTSVTWAAVGLQT